MLAPAASLSMFGAKLDLSKLDWFMHWMLSYGKESIPEGYWRDWNAISTWAEDAGKVLLVYAGLLACY